MEKFQAEINRLFKKYELKGLAIYCDADGVEGYANKIFSEATMPQVALFIAMAMDKDKEVFELFCFAWQLAFENYPDLKEKIELISIAGKKSVH